MGYIGIIDYGVGNLMSVVNTLNYLGCENKIVTSVKEIEESNGIILPGVGAFPDAMKALEESGLIEALVAQSKMKPFLGICLGMQLLFEESEEVECTKGLGLIKGRIERIETKYKLPQIGWNQLEFKQDNPLVKGVEEGEYVYFVHSFMAKHVDKRDLIATCEYGADIPAIVQSGNIYGCQFHPEKSGEVGLKIIENFVKLVKRRGK